MRWLIALLLSLSFVLPISSQDQDVTLYLNGFSDFTQNGSAALLPTVSIRHHYPSTTEMLLGCATSVPNRGCVIGGGVNYTIVSDNTYLGSWSTSAPDMFVHFTCVHNLRNASVICQEEKQNQLGYYTSNMVYAAVPEDFVTVPVHGGSEKLRTAEQPLSAATPAANCTFSSTATLTATAPNTKSTNGAEKRKATTYTLFSAIGVALCEIW
ncbi:hypothetical protein FB567DRAFT_551857 [Paraphoma chrysanthemicola]|uniref:Uncharacterized protein n=1 Tax=Paraphoma chrysanthemicola TaxID=798071 RepID=A0A8K0VR87_9PLEO|nr:hypothetical protein FB567DRAFT_555945 [Paraphoma chrysanthemicola]KAH7066438.1 hypothetical protein FB567DRAFT_555937 [Paraphoma chrysanthemicola]KAH7067958.1 hypothetical protein FB567DRAFT_555551 [Paraphoma chrysanthemicola]KAH7079409.1 hypothetical protein FB567DRAFT_551857 [Paraphoma chrysanthemicola]